MTFEINIAATVALVTVIVLIIGLVLERGLIIVSSAIIFVVSSVTYCETRPERIAEKNAEAEEARRQSIPHVIRDADGCKVYAFREGAQWHYFTRCADMVTTDRSYTVTTKVGKSTKTENKVETIVTRKAE